MRLSTPFVIIFYLLISDQKIAVAKPWGHDLQIALQKLVLKQDQESLSTTAKIYESSESQQTEKKAAEENLLYAFSEGHALSESVLKNKPYDHIDLIFSINRQWGKGENSSIEIEIKLTQKESPDKVILEKDGKSIFKINKDQFQSRYKEKPEIVFGRNLNYQSLPSSGLFKLQLQFKKENFTELVLIDSFPPSQSWPRLHKVSLKNKGT